MSQITGQPGPVSISKEPIGSETTSRVSSTTTNAPTLIPSSVTGDSAPETDSTPAFSQGSDSGSTNEQSAVKDGNRTDASNWVDPSSTEPNAQSSPIISTVKTPRKLSVYPPGVHNSGSTVYAANSASLQHPPLTSQASYNAQTPIVPKPATSSLSSSVPIAPKINKSASSSGTPSFSHDQPSATPLGSGRKRAHSNSRTPTSSLPLKLVPNGGAVGQGLQPQARISSFQPAQHMSTYRRHKGATPQQSFNQQVSTGIYTAIYSDIPVFEMMINGVAVMRRRNDSSLNATQILKVAGVDKSKRTKILEREILTGKHEKVQGGYGKYQGTWIPYDRGVDLCRQYSVYELLQPLLELDIESAEIANTPTKEQAMAARRKAASQGLQSQPTYNHPLQVGSPHQTPLAQSASEAFSNLRAGRSDTVAALYRPNSALSDSNLANHSYSYPTTTPIRGGLGLDHDSYHANTASDDIHLAKRQRHGDLYGVFTPSRNLSLRAPGSGNTVDQGDFDDTDIRSARSNRSIHSRSGYDIDDEYIPFVLDESLIPDSNTPLEPLDKNNTPFFDHSQEVICNIFTNLNTPLYSILGYPPPPPSYRPGFGNSYQSPNFSLDVPIDPTGHTALHWAACLGQIILVRDLIRYGANPLRASYEGESALVRSVLVTNNYDTKNFSKLLDLLYPNLILVDKKKRSVLHHIALTAGIKDRAVASKYYLECLIDWVKTKGTSNPEEEEEEGSRGKEPDSTESSEAKKQGEGKLSYDNFVKNIVNLQDNNGDTALNIAARVGNRSIVELLLDFGASPFIPNRAGLRPIDFGIKVDGTSNYSINDIAEILNGNSIDEPSSSGSGELGDISIMTELAEVDTSKYSKSVLQSLSRSKPAQRKVLDTIRIMLGELQTTFLEDLSTKEKELQRVRSELHQKNALLAQTEAKCSRLVPDLDKLRKMRKQAQNLECAILKEDEKFKTEEEKQGRSPSSADNRQQANGNDKPLARSELVSAIDYEGNFDADQPFRMNSIAALYEKVEKEMRDEKTRQKSDLKEDKSSSTAQTDGKSAKEEPIDYEELERRVKSQIVQQLKSGSIRFVNPRSSSPPVQSSPTTITETLPLKSLLRARIKAYTQNAENIKAYRQSILDNYSDLEPLFRKVVSVCTAVPETKVDELLTQFVKAVESDPEEVDLSRVAGFLKKVDAGE